MKKTTRLARTLGVLLSIGMIAGGVLGPAVADAAAVVAPRDDLKAAYANAESQFNNLELDAAQATLEGAIAQAQSAGLGSDPGIAPLLVLRAGIIYTNTGDTAKTTAAFGEAVRADYYIAIPIELRSPELQQMLDAARAQVGAPPAGGPIEHVAPVAAGGMDIPIEAHMRVTMMEGFQAALYWRNEGDAEFKSVEMETFGNLAWATITAAEHGDKTIEYAIYAFDSNQQAIANKGDTDNPMRIEIAGAGLGDPTGGDAGGDEGGDEGGDDGGGKPPPGGKKIGGFFNIGLGTGLGVASGTAELSFKQYSPLPSGALGPGDASDTFNYTLLEQACAIARWWGSDKPKGGRMVATLPSAQEFDQVVLPTLGTLTGQMEDQGLKGPLSGLNSGDLSAAYAQGGGSCDDRHPVSTGMALAPFHIAPEFGLRIKDKIMLSLYGRLQIVTGSKVFRGDDPDQSEDPATHFNNVINNPLPQKGVRDKPPFTWAAGLKFRYLFRPPEKKLRLFAGAFLGGGFARLMVDMGFANDGNGNSVPDNQEIGADLVFNPQTQSLFCVPVWPYNGSCLGDNSDIDGASPDFIQAANYQQGSSNTSRVDTVVIGSFHAGALFGFNAQLHKNFAIYGEVQAGGWFPNTSSFLLDINIGPSITF